MLDKKLQTPLWKQLKDKLIKQVLSDNYKKGDKFYSLSEIADQYQVSMITVRRVMQEMGQEGYLEVIPGKKARIAEMSQKKPSATLKKVAVFFYSPVPGGNIEYDIMPWTSLIFSGMQECFIENNLLWTMVPAQNAEDARGKLKQLENDHQAFIFLSPSISDYLETELSKLKIPYLLIQPRGHRYSFNYVAADYYAGSAEIAEAAIRKNYRSFLYLCGNYIDAVEKMRGFQETLLGHGIPCRKIHQYCSGDISIAGGMAAFEKFLSENRQDDLFPLAVYASGDHLALGALAVCRRLGLAVPDQVGIAGSTGIPETEHSDPPLTTIEIPMRKIGQVAVKLICEMLETGQSLMPGRTLSVKLISRNSF